MKCATSSDASQSFRSGGRRNDCSRLNGTKFDMPDPSQTHSRRGNPQPDRLLAPKTPTVHLQSQQQQKRHHLAQFPEITCPSPRSGITDPDMLLPRSTASVAVRLYTNVVCHGPSLRNMLFS